MAATFPSFRSPIASSNALPNPPRKSNNWWAPIFGFSSEPDYITNRSSNPVKLTESSLDASETGQARADKNFFRGCFTEEKAKELRKKTIETTTFHDIMYHSAIASRLASDLSERHDR